MGSRRERFPSNHQGARPPHRVMSELMTTPFPCFLSTERVCSEAEQGLPCEIVRISQGREKAEKRVVQRGDPPHLPCRHGCEAP
jgi:hypothetical protein